MGIAYQYLFTEIKRTGDGPGIIPVGLVVIFASLVVATFAAVLQKLLQSAADLQSENELTV